MKKGFIIALLLFRISLLLPCNELYFENFMISGKSQGYENVNPNLEAQLQKGIKSYIDSQSSGISKKNKDKYIIDAYNIFSELWVSNKRDEKVTFYYCYGLLGSITTKLDLQEISSRFMKVKGMLGYLIGKNPDNLNGRGLRITVFMNIPNIPGGSERPDETILEDVDVFLSNYSKLPEKINSEDEAFLEMFCNTAYVARALVLLEKGYQQDGLKALNSVDESFFIEMQIESEIENPIYQTWLELKKKYAK